MSAVGVAIERSTAASILADLGRRVLELPPTGAPGRRRAAQQLNLQGEMVAAGGDLEVAQAWIDAGRVYVLEIEQVGGVSKIARIR